MFWSVVATAISSCFYSSELGWCGKFLNPCRWNGLHEASVLTIIVERIVMLLVFGLASDTQIGMFHTLLNVFFLEIDRQLFEYFFTLGFGIGSSQLELILARIWVFWNRADHSGIPDDFITVDTAAKFI